jgi:hypothetical protein
MDIGRYYNAFQLVYNISKRCRDFGGGESEAGGRLKNWHKMTEDEKIREQ